ncbi:thiol reductant ABC exporter subunit CydC [Actinomadura sp. 21ATH]|uniref:thiol reductant ABC exporter subunit CydC n=1 Tax=Actinomadura sp. 21ATH TaxID=1735444 RepID=UPI0035C18114
MSVIEAGAAPATTGAPPPAVEIARKTGPRGPLDPRLLSLSRLALGPLAWLVTLSVAHALAVVGIALTAAALVVAVLSGDQWRTPLAGLALALLVRAAAAALLPGAAHRVSAPVIAAVRREGLAAVARRGQAWAAHRGARSEAVDVATLLSTGLDPLRPWFASYLPSLVVAAVLPPVVVALLAFVDPPSALTVLVTLPLVPLFAALVGWATQRRSDQQYARGGALAGHFLDAVRGLVTLRLFDRAERQEGAVRESSHRYARATTRVLSVAFLSSTALDLVATVSVGLVAVGAGTRLAGGEMMLWPALAAILLAPEAYRPLREAGARFHESAQASAVMDRWQQITDVPVVEAADGATTSAVAGARGLRVRFPGRRAELSLPEVDVRAGEIVAISGPSGSGKTTLLRAMAGLLDADRGHAWAHDAEYVPQRPALPLAGTVRDALQHGSDTAVDDAELTGLLASLALPVSSLARGLDTPLGDDGRGLSTGQRHRVALARAILAVTRGGRATLLLDEPTAHLDRAAETAVIEAVTTVARAGVAVVVASHRPAVIAAADRRVDVIAGSPPGTEAGDVRPRGEVHPPTPAPAAGLGERSRRRPLLAGPRRRWSRAPASTRFALAAAAGAASLLSGFGLTVAAAWMIIRADARPPILTLSVAVVAVRAFAIARPLWRYLERLASHDAGLGLLADWRAKVIGDLVPQVPGRLTARRGALLVRVVDDVDTRLSGRVRGRVPLAAAAVTLVVVAGATAWLLPGALVPLLLGIAIAGVAAPWWTIRADRRAARPADEARTGLQDAIVGAVENTEELGLARGRVLMREVHTRGQRADDAERAAARADGQGRGIAEFGAAVLVVGAAVVAARAWAGRTIPAETVGIVVLAALAVTEALLSMLPAARALADGRAAGARLDALRQDSVPPETAPAPIEDVAVVPGVQVAGLSVGWRPEAPVLRDVDLRIAPGDVHELRWPSGSGKSTLAMALAGLLSPSAGEIRAGGARFGAGASTSGMDARALRRRVAVAGDADHIFATTVRANLLLADPGADDDRLRAALRAALLDGWLDGLTDGLDTWLDSGGRTLSGGERRRFVLARALLRDPDVLVLDEPTAGLDDDTAGALLAALRRDAADHSRAVLLLTHRP